MIVKLLLRYLNSEDVENRQDNGKGMFAKIHKDMKEVFKKAEEDDPDKDAKAKDSEKEEVKPEIKKEDSATTPLVRIDRLREFKINGSIGAVGQKDSMTYISLSCQLEQGKDAGYKFKEIVAAVVKAIKPGTHLRDYLESRLNLKTLDEKSFLQLLQSHFAERNCNSVFTELTRAAQLPSESEMDFCLRAMNLRQNVQRLSKNEGRPFDETWLNNTFIESVANGFKYDRVRLELQSILKSGSISDEELLREVGVVMASEQERSTRWKAKASANELTVSRVQMEEESANDKKSKSKKSKQVKESKDVADSSILTEINKLTVKINELTTTKSDEMKSVRGEIQDLRNQMTCRENGNHCCAKDSDSDSNLKSNRPPRRVFKCQGCQRTNKSYCNHCFICGAEGHRSYDCPNKEKN